MAKRRKGQVEVDEEIVAAQILAVEAERDELAAMLGDGQITIGEFKLARPGIDERLNALRSQLVVPEAKPWAGDGVGLASAWGSMTTKEKRHVIRSWFADLKVVPRKSLDAPPKFDPDRVQITPR